MPNPTLLRSCGRPTLLLAVSLMLNPLITATQARGDAKAETIVASVSEGVLHGRREADVDVFRGIPYAAPPVGDLRWRAPRPPASWQGARAADAFGDVCIQQVAGQEPEISLRERPQSEDCLNLNVWAPAERDGLLPVMVWVHGGSFRFGSGSLPTYDGSALARRGAVVVTLNYRLALFGTFAHPAVRHDGEPGGNFGLLDVIRALEWVRDNIAAFGGDPANVTLFGESAGGVSVGYLMASPLAEGLFHRAIVQSGGLSLPEYSRERAEEIGHTIAVTLGEQDTDALRALPAQTIRDVALSAADTMPFIDGDVVLERNRDAFEGGRVARVPLVIGANNAEAGFFGPRYWKNFPAEIGAGNFARLRQDCFGFGADGPDACAMQASGELFAGVNTRAIARGASRTQPTYAYRFAHVPTKERTRKVGAYHTDEIAYVFGHVAADPASDPASARISERLADAWVRFARTGDPTGEDLGWARFEASESERTLLIGNEGSEMGENPANALLDAIDALNAAPRP